MVLPTVHSIRSGEKLTRVRAAVTSSAAIDTGLESVTAAVTWTDDLGSLGPQRTVCGHPSTSTMTLLESAGETYCLSCFVALKQVVADYDSGKIDSTDAEARLRALGLARGEEIACFLQQLAEPAAPSDLRVARATTHRLRDEQMLAGAKAGQENDAEPVIRGITVRCKQCGRVLFDDPRTWPLGHFEPTQLGLELLAARSGPRASQRLDLPDVRGGLVRSAVDIVVEDLGQGRGAMLHIRPHRRPRRGGLCPRSPSIGFAELLAACSAAEGAGQDHIRI